MSPARIPLLPPGDQHLPNNDSPNESPGSAREEVAGGEAQTHPSVAESVVPTTEPTVGIIQFARHIYTVVASKSGISSDGPR